MRVHSLLGLSLLSLLGCRRGHAQGPRDPRIRFATSCEDPRFVSSEPAVIPGLRTLHPASALLGARSLTAGASDRGVFATVGAETIPLGASATPDARVSIAATTLGFVLAFRGPAGARALLLSPEGRALHTLEMPWCTGDPSVAAYGQSALALCVQHLRGQPDGMALHRIDPLGRAELIARVPCPLADCREPVLARVGSSALVAFIAGSDGIYTARLDLRRRSFDPPRLLMRPAENVQGLALASSGQRIALAWSDNRAGALALHATSLSLRGDGSGVEQRLSIRYLGEPASLAWDGAAFGITWSEPVSGGAQRSYLALLEPSGLRIGTQMRLYVPDDSAAMNPALVWRGRGYGITYARADGSVEARATGPRGCDGPP